MLENPERHLVHAGVHHVFVKHTDELRSSDGQQKVFEPLEGRFVTVPNRDSEPAEGDLVIACRRELEGLVEILELVATQLLRHAVEKALPVVIRPFTGVDVLCRDAAGEPVLPRSLDRLEGRRLRHRCTFGQAGPENPLPYALHAHRLGMVHDKRPLEVIQKFFRRDTLKRELVKVIHQEAVERLAADCKFEFVQKQGTFLVRDAREHLVRIATA